MQSSVDNFTRITGFDLSRLLGVSDIFFSTQQPSLIDYYQGVVSTADQKAVVTLNYLETQYTTVLHLFGLYSGQFKSQLDWEVLYLIEAFNTKIKTTQNLGKYLRSNKTRAGFSPTQTLTVPLMPNATIESVIGQYNKGTAENNWQSVAISNDLKEGDYGPDGNDLSLEIPLQASAGAAVQTVLGYAVGEELYGRDIQRRFSLQDDDLLALEPRPTQRQSMEILQSLKKGDIPEYTSIGLDSILGSNKATATFQIPAILRQLRDIYSTDDTFTNLQIIEVKIVQDSVQIDIAIDTAYNTKLQQTLTF